MRLLWLGGYHRDAERNVILLRGLAENGVELIERHFPLEFLRFCGSPLGLTAARAAVALPLHAIRLAHGARAAADADAVFVGYLGHLDLAVLALLRPFLSSLRRTPLVFDPFFSLYDTVVNDRALLGKATLSARLLRALERCLLRRADVILADTAAHATYYAALAGLPPERLRVVPVGVDETLFAPREPAPPGKVTKVLFYGTYIPLHGIPTILEAAHLLRSEPVHFRLIGQGQTRAAADAQAREMSLTNVEFTDGVPRRQLPDEIARADIVLGIFGCSDNAARVVPNKVYQAMAVGRCVITRECPAIAEAFTAGEHLVTCPAGDPAALAAAIHALAGDALRRVEIGHVASELVQERFRCSAVAQALVAAITNVG